MKHLKYFLFLTFAFFGLFYSCAKRGYITGGPKDSLSPILLKATPDNFSTNFNEKTIKLSFDEFVKLKNINQQLIISPPMNEMPEISPMGLANKTISIKIKDTLQPNTTYSLNFGNSIVDNNEENPLQAFKYIFSTGNFIDSLKLKVSLKDAYAPAINQEIKVILYPADSFSDSIIFKKKPLYVAHVSKDQTTATLENIKAGKYHLFALTDENNNYTFQPKTEKIAFISQTITLPTDSTFVMTLFKEKTANNINRPSMISKNKWLVPFEGEYKNIKINVSDFEKELPSAFYKITNKDSLHVFIPETTKDSLKFSFSNNNYSKDYTVRVRTMKNKDSLVISVKNSNTIHFRDSLKIEATTPIVRFDKEKIKLTTEKEESTIFEVIFDKLKNLLYIIFDKKENTSYKLHIAPGAITDIFEKTNDSMQWEGKTKAFTDYASLSIKIEHSEEKPLIFELLNDKNQPIYKTTVPKNNQLDFLRLETAKYNARIIIDTNENGKWDSGNYLEKIQPEKIIYFLNNWDARANWELNETINITK